MKTKAEETVEFKVSEMPTNDNEDSVPMDSAKKELEKRLFDQLEEVSEEHDWIMLSSPEVSESKEETVALTSGCKRVAVFND